VVERLGQRRRRLPPVGRGVVDLDDLRRSAVAVESAGDVDLSVEDGHADLGARCRKVGALRPRAGRLRALG
jgi:hypothetical protein